MNIQCWMAYHMFTVHCPVRRGPKVSTSVCGSKKFDIIFIRVTRNWPRINVFFMFKNNVYQFRSKNIKDCSKLNEDKFLAKKMFLAITLNNYAYQSNCLNVRLEMEASCRLAWKNTIFLNRVSLYSIFCNLSNFD